MDRSSRVLLAAVLVTGCPGPQPSHPTGVFERDAGDADAGAAAQPADAAATDSSIPEAAEPPAPGPPDAPIEPQGPQEDDGWVTYTDPRDGIYPLRFDDRVCRQLYDRYNEIKARGGGCREDSDCGAYSDFVNDTSQASDVETARILRGIVTDARERECPYFHFDGGGYHTIRPVCLAAGCGLAFSPAVFPDGYDLPPTLPPTSPPAEVRRIIVGTTRLVSPQTAGPGQMDPSVFRARLRGRRLAIERCYNTNLAHDPELGGEATFLVAIDVHGAVTVSCQSDSPALDAAGVTECVRRALEVMNFGFHAPTGGDFSVRLPFVFRRADDQEPVVP
jgi:hypothetical protein